MKSKNKKNNHEVEKIEYGLPVIYRHDYNFRKDEINSYIKKSCQFFKEFITNVPGNKEFETFLDIGCGDSSSLNFFQEQYNVKGIDLYPAVEDDRIVKGDFYDLSSFEKQDLIFCNHTLEHSLAPLLLEQISKIHKIGGAIFIAVPDGDYSWAYDITSSTTHWSLFNAGFLRHLLTRYGYECHVEKKCFRENKGELFLVGIKRF